MICRMCWILLPAAHTESLLKRSKSFVVVFFFFKPQYPIKYEALKKAQLSMSLCVTKENNGSNSQIIIDAAVQLHNWPAIL